jgi:RNA polymerase sigma factor (sigma-70 family)
LSRSVIADGSATAENEPDSPLTDRRRQEASAFLRDHGAAFRATARRFAASPQDAEDALQRAAELFLTKGPTTSELRARINWMHVVIRHEALRLRRVQQRSIATEAIEEIAGLAGRGGTRPEASDPAEVIERKVGYAEFRQAYRRLKPDEQRALRLIGEGYSYSEIAELTGWSRTKINRHLAEGRAKMRNLLGRIEEGVRCAELAGPLSRYVDGEASERERREVDDHLKSCLACRATARSYRQTPRSAAAFFPILPASSWLSDRFQALAGWIQTRLPARGQLGEAVVLGAGSGGAGSNGAVATLAKLAVICAGAGGSAAACVAAGVLPPLPVDGIEKQAERPGSTKAVEPSPTTPLADASTAEAEPEQTEAGRDRAENEKDSAAEENGRASEPDQVAPDPVEAEFGLEAGGEAVGAPVAIPQASTSDSQPAAPPMTAPTNPSVSGPGSDGAGSSPAPNRMPPRGGSAEFGP